MALVIRPHKTLHFQFLLGFNECFWAFFSQLSFISFWLYLLGCVCKYSFHICYINGWLKSNLSANFHQMLRKCWESSVTRKLNLNFISVIKNSSFDWNFVYTWSKAFQKVFVLNFLFHAQNVSSLAVQFYHVRHENLKWSDTACTSCIEGWLYPSTLVIFEKCLLFTFLFLKFEQLILFFFFSKIGDKCCSIFRFVTRVVSKSWVYHQLNVFKVIRMVYYNHTYLWYIGQPNWSTKFFTHLFNFLELFHSASIHHS